VLLNHDVAARLRHRISSRGCRRTLHPVTGGSPPFRTALRRRNESASIGTLPEGPRQGCGSRMSPLDHLSDALRLRGQLGHPAQRFWESR